MLHFSRLTGNIICIKNAVSVRTGTFGTMAESEFQRSLHRVDSHKSSARVCGVSIEVRQVETRQRVRQPATLSLLWSQQVLGFPVTCAFIHPSFL